MIDQLSHVVLDIGGLLLEWRNSKIIEGRWEGQQFKAIVDKMAHDALTERLVKLMPDIPIISEEDRSSLVKMRPSRYWLIDPIDGTASFVNGYQGFVTQVVLIVDNSPLIAAICAPVLGLLYVAKRGCGAFLNGKRLCLVPHKELETLIDNYPEPRGIALDVYNELKIKKYIECGSISLKICKVADGTADIFFKNVIVRDWDLGAPQLVLEEAGGAIKDSNGEKISYDGNYEHNGVIASASEKACLRVASWYDNYIKRGK